jgi:hypothetical protein
VAVTGAAIAANQASGNPAKRVGAYMKAHWKELLALVLAAIPALFIVFHSGARKTAQQLVTRPPFGSGFGFDPGPVPVPGQPAAPPPPPPSPPGNPAPGTIYTGYHGTTNEIISGATDNWAAIYADIQKWLTAHPYSSAEIRDAAGQLIQYFAPSQNQPRPSPDDAYAGKSIKGFNPIQVAAPSSKSSLTAALPSSGAAMYKPKKVSR